jgi:hypothetical protein
VIWRIRRAVPSCRQRDQRLGAPVLRQPCRAHRIAVVVDQPGSAGSSRDCERGRAGREVRHDLAQLTERGRSCPPGFADLLLGAAAGKSRLACYRRGDACELVTIRRKRRRLDSRRADVESDQEIVGQCHRRSNCAGVRPPDRTRAVLVPR